MKKRTKFLNTLRKLLLWILGPRSLRFISMGFSPNSIRGKIIPSHYLFKDDDIKVLEIDSLTYRLDLSKVVDHSIYFGFSDKGFEHFIQLLEPEFIVFDIGANIGVTALPISKRVSRVFAFEPSTSNFKKLTEHVEINSIQNIELFQLGIGDQEASMLLETINPANPGMNRISPNKSLTNYSENVKITSLDNFVAKNNIKIIDAIKIDIEGFELKAIEGARQILKDQHPLLFIELDDNYLQEQGANALTLITELRNLGYNSICKANTSQEINTNFDFANCHFDILVSKST